MRTHPDNDLRALGVRQPWAELILQGRKTIEVRSQPTTVRGTIYVYASKVFATTPAALAAASRNGIDLKTLILGRLVGTVEIVGCRDCTPDDAVNSCLPAELLTGNQAWLLAEPMRLDAPLPVSFLPYGVWFYPFQRRGVRRRPR